MLNNVRDMPATSMHEGMTGMGDPIRNQNLQTNRSAGPSQETASTSSEMRTDRSDGAPVTPTETTQGFHHLRQGSWTSRPEMGARKRKRKMEAEGTTAEGRTTGSCDDGANRQPTAGAAGSDRAKRLEVDSGPTASGYRNHGSHRLRQATHPTQSSSSFDPDGGRQARFTDGSQSEATKSGSGLRQPAGGNPDHCDFCDRAGITSAKC